MQRTKAGDVAGFGADCFGDEVVLEAKDGEERAGGLFLGHVEAVARGVEEVAREVACLLDFGYGVAEVVEVIQIVGYGETGFDGALANLIYADVRDERRPVEAERERGVAEGALGRVNAEVLAGGLCDFGRENGFLGRPRRGRLCARRAAGERRGTSC